MGLWDTFKTGVESATETVINTATNVLGAIGDEIVSKNGGTTTEVTASAVDSNSSAGIPDASGPNYTTAAQNFLKDPVGLAVVGVGVVGLFFLLKKL